VDIEELNTQRFITQDRATTIASEAAEARASALARELDLRLQAVTAELADVHRDIARVMDLIPAFLTREEYGPRHDQLQAQITTDTSRLDRIEGTKSGTADFTARAIAAIAAIAAVGGVIILIVFHG